MPLNRVLCRSCGTVVSRAELCPYNNSRDAYMLCRYCCSSCTYDVTYDKPTSKRGNYRIKWMYPPNN